MALGWKSSQTNVLCLKQKQGDYLEEGTKRLPCRQRQPSRGICTRPSGRVLTSHAFSRPSASPAPLNTCLAQDVPELVSSLLCSPPWTVLGQTCHFHGP